MQALLYNYRVISENTQSSFGRQNAKIHLQIPTFVM